MDSDCIILKNMDWLFGVPEADLSAPRAYWLDPGVLKPGCGSTTWKANDGPQVGLQMKFTSAVMVVNPSTRLWTRIWDRYFPGGKPKLDVGMYDMDLLNIEFKDEAVLLRGETIMILSLHYAMAAVDPLQYPFKSRVSRDELYEMAGVVHFSPTKPWTVTSRQSRPGAHERFYQAHELWTNVSKQVQPHNTPLLSTVLLLHAVGVPPPTSPRLRRRVLGVCKATVQQAQQQTQLQREQTKPQHRRQQQRPPARRLAAEWELSIPADAGARAITREISGCRSWRDLRDTADRHAADLNPIHVAALLAKAAKFVPPDSPAWSKSAAEVAAEEGDELRQWVTRGLLPLFDGKLEVLGPRGTANGLWALAKAGCPLPAPLMRRAAGALLQHAPRLEGQHLSSFVWALARWAQLPEERAAAAAVAREAATTSTQAHSQEPQRQAAGPSSSSSGTENGGSSIAGDELLTGAAVESGPRAAAAELVPGLSPARLQELLDAAAHCLPAAGSQVHSNLLYGLACLRHRPPALWIAGFWAASLPALPEAQPQHLSNALWAAARLGAPPPEPWLRAWAAAATRRLLRSTAQGCSNMVWAAATLGWDPGEQWMAAWLAATRPRLVGFPEQAFSISCWALGRMARRRRLRREAAEVDWQLGEAAAGAAAAAALGSGAGVCGDGTDGESGKEAEALSRGGEEGRPSAPTRDQPQQEPQQQEYAQEQQREQQEQQQQRGQRREREAHGSAPDVRTLTDAWVASGLAVAQGRAAAYTARQLSTTLWGLGCLLPAGGGSKGGAAGGGAAVEALFSAAAARMGEMNPQELSNVLLSAARLGVRPGAAWMGLYEGASAALLADSHAQHHANVLWAMARLGHVPGDGWVAALAGDAEARLWAAADEAAATAAAAAAGAAAALEGESSGGGDGGAAGVELP
ncbi:hypothetical protein MNEG_9321, partial [Monoraphidium neglectum]